VRWLALIMQGIRLLAFAIGLLVILDGYADHIAERVYQEAGRTGGS
jgi:predicted hydrocarbon binding protein